MTEKELAVMRSQMAKDFTRDADFFEAGTRKMLAHMENEKTQAKYKRFVDKLNKKHDKLDKIHREKMEKEKQKSEKLPVKEPVLDQAPPSPLKVVKDD